MFWKMAAIIALSTTAMLSLASCGESDPKSTPVAAGSSGEGDAIHVRMLDTMRFDPDTIGASAGQQLTIDLENAGMLPHTFTIDEADVDVELKARERETITFTVPGQAGEYEIYCAIPGHRAAGMVATLIIN